MFFSFCHANAASTVDTSIKVYDGANLFTSSQISQLSATLNQYGDELNVDFVVLTTNSTGSDTDEAYADDFYDYNGFKTLGVLLLIDMGNGEIHITTSGDFVIKYMTNRRINSIVNDITPDLKSKDYFSASKEFADLSYNYIKLGNTKTVSERVGQSLAYIPFYIIGGVIISSIVLFILFKKNKAQNIVQERTYLKQDSFKLNKTNDIYVNTTVTRVRNASNTGGGRGGSSTHMGSSGTPHGGGGGRF
jgi:uncharacterized protein